VSADFSILKDPIAGDQPEPLGTLDEVRARVERAIGVALAEDGVIAGRAWELAYRAVIEDGVVTMLRCSLRSPCTPRRPQLVGDWADALRSIASALDATALDEQAGVPLGALDDDDDLPAPERTDDFVIALVPSAGPRGSIGDAAEIWRDLERRLGIGAGQPAITGDGWQLRVVGATAGPLRRLELHLGWANVRARTAVLERCATINDGDGWVALDVASGDVFPLDWFL
jgi:hypothetical protein